MDPFPVFLFPLLFPAVFGGGFLVFAITRTQARTAAWRATAQHVGLTELVEKTTLGFVTALEGRVDPFRVRIESYRRGKHERGTRITVLGGGRIPHGLDLRSEGFFSQMDKVLGGKEIELGDLAFDNEIYARGPEDVLRAVLDARTRSLLSGVARMNGRVLEGGVRVEIKGWAPPPERLNAVLDAMLDLARHLERPAEVVARLAEQVRSDPQQGVRERCLAYLASAHAQHPEARAVFREALTMASPELRLRAAIALGAEGRDVLLELAMPTVETQAHAVRAITALGKDLPLDRALSILDTARSLGLREAARAAIVALGLIREGDVLPLLTPLAVDPDRDLALAAVGALQARGDSRAEPTLIALLSSDTGTLRMAAAEALGGLGTAAAVAPLHAAVDDHLLDLDLRGAARQAIAKIQSRLPGASPGQLSIAAGEEGQLSMAEQGQGRVSLARETE